MQRTIHTRFPGRAVRLLLFLVAFAQASFCAGMEPRYDVGFPDVAGHRTLVCDFHMHTVFSDGSVWPYVRLNEAWRTGLDMISITDHIEYHPYEEDVVSGHNRSNDLVVKNAAIRGLLFARGAEITRATPPGHYNAIFLKDIEPLDTPRFLDSIEAANKQGAFVFWNHHEWKGKAKGKWTELQDTMVEKKWLHGMEVANGAKYYPRAHRWCLEKGMTMLGNSDIHDPDLRRKSAIDDHRSLTLVFAKERTVESVKEALCEGRTAVWHKDLVIGREEHLRPLFDACLKVEPIHHRTEGTVWLKLRNTCPVDLKLKLVDPENPHALKKPAYNRKSHLYALGPTLEALTLPGQSVTLLCLDTSNVGEEVRIDYVVENFLVTPEKGLTVSVTIPITD